ncbi:MAG: hypothetical protein EOO89_23295 [Pedobacter sp.]|nr:MAG: hypothetical protein EOO89_23295 [Pedobacter sp.]
MNTESYRNSFDNNTVVGGSPRKIDSLSNNFDFLSNSHIGKGVLQWRETKFTLNAGLEATQTSFKLNDLDRNKTFNRSFLNLGPTSNFSYKVGSNSNVSVNYTGTTRQPSLEQLQPIRELTNPLYLIVGNPLLKPSFTNAIRSNFNSFSAKTEQYISAGVFYNFINNEIVNVESIDQNNRRVITYINIDGNRNYGTNIYYDKEIGINKFRMNINASLNYNRSERTAVINGIFNRSLTNSTNAGFGFGFDTKGIRMYYNGNANILTGRSTIGALFAGNSITHDHNVRTNVILPYKMTFVTNVSMSFRPRNAVFTQPLNVTQWDASIVAKAMKNNALQITLGVTDILKERIGYNRSVGGNTISESTYSFIPRYVLLGVNYNISGDFNKK